MKKTPVGGMTSVTLAFLLALLPIGPPLSGGVEDAINPNVIADYNRAAAFVKDVRIDFDRFLADPQCGSKASLDSLNQFFQNQMQNLVAVGGVAGKLGDAALATAPAALEAGRILTEAAALAGAVATAGAKARQDFDALTKAIGDLQKEARQIAGLDLVGTAADGAALVGSVGPFLGACAGCASAMASAIGALDGATSAVGAAACPESAAAFGGACWATVAGVSAAASSPLLAAIGSTPCTGAVGDLSRMQDYVAKVTNFVSSTVNLVQGVRNSVAALVAASNALVKLGQDLGSESAPRLSRIETSLNNAIDALNKASGIVEDEVTPKVARLGGDLVTQIGDNIGKLVVCYGKMQDTAEEIGGEAGQAMADYISAGALLVDAGQVLTSIGTQGQSGINAARSRSARSKFDQAALKARSSLARFQAQKNATKGRRFAVPRIPANPLPILRAGLLTKSVAKVRLGALAAR